MACQVRNIDHVLKFWLTGFWKILMSTVPMVNWKSHLVSKRKKVSPHDVSTFLWILFTLLILCGVGVSVLTFKPSYDTSIILPGDTIRIPLPSRLPPFLEIVFTGQRDSCSSRVIALTCTDVKSFHKDFDGAKVQHYIIDYIYLTPGSHVTVFPSDVLYTQPEKDASYYTLYIGLFMSITSAMTCENYINHNYDSFNDCCEKNGVSCKSIRRDSKEPTILNVSQASYYFLRCDGSGYNCSDLHHYYINQTGYNFPKSNELISGKAAKLKVQDMSPTILKIHKEYFAVQNIYNTCVLAKLEGDCGNQSDKYFLNINYLTEYHEYIVYISMGIGSICFIVFSINIGICCYMRRFRRKEDIPRQDPGPEDPLSEVWDTSHMYFQCLRTLILFPCNAPTS